MFHLFLLHCNLTIEDKSRHRVEKVQFYKKTYVNIQQMHDEMR